ncbi:MAG: hypothetical protein SCARUB_04417 [Candidatus Scalindua rubra]|uniref:Uncharacterized protein n=1 Tax=Candidatus Scalindua rubra TaxID=1872076 RepID=A0A1E3X4E4_9BACT|nr:MAG: hypothetical protein SCARUB_04417 [Candidatus Scalindua rubra]
MRNKKLLILIILSVAAVLSLIYGIATTPKGRRGLISMPADVYQDEKAQLTKGVIPTKRDAKRTGFVSWGRDPFLLPQEPAKTSTRLNLNGIIWDEEDPIAIINDNFIEIGDKIEKNTVVDIKEDSVILNDGANDFELRLE